MSDATLAPTDETPFRVMRVTSVDYDLSRPSPEVHLIETDGGARTLVIPMALPEATALHLALQSQAGRRPTTHELLATILATLQAEVVALRLTRHDRGVFYAELEIMTPRGREVFDCRPSDGLIAAARQRVPAPILCAEKVLAAFVDPAL
jgi:uncharacterized protein